MFMLSIHAHTNLATHVVDTSNGAKRGGARSVAIERAIAASVREGTALLRLLKRPRLDHDERLEEPSRAQGPASYRCLRKAFIGDQCMASNGMAGMEGIAAWKPWDHRQMLDQKLRFIH